jgi:ABC-type bacteriocin/lantibiotic exporter with double-glycine peptidase domain
VEPWSGTLNYDGIERSKHSRYVLTQSIAMVNQDVFLFEGSIRDNLSLWDLTIDDSILLQACRDACVLEDIMLRPGGLDSPVEEGGRNFSGGQRQRLEIARALAQNPSILILDEATSALDALTESLFISNLERRGCTCLIVAHRMSTIRDCDYILVMSNGMVVESGNHDSLVANDGPYRQLISNV